MPVDEGISSFTEKQIHEHYWGLFLCRKYLPAHVGVYCREEQRMLFLSKFANPPREYSPVPFWFLNERLTEERLKWQLDQMHKQHVYGCIMHARPGLITPYLSEEWFAMIGGILERAEALDMFCWIYDEYPWHSGMAEWRVPQLHPDFRIRALDRLEKRVDGPGEVVWDLSRELPGDAANVVSCVHTPLYKGKLLGPGKEISSWLDNGRLDYKVPAGEHHIAVYFERLSYNPYGDKFGCFPVTDLMHPEGIQAFLELTHREYERRFGHYFGKTITATFTDEPPSDTPGWSTVFAHEFERRKGYDLRPYLGLLWHEAGQITGKVRYDYADVVGSLYEESYFGAIEQWADQAGIFSTGHLLLEETLLFHARFMGDYFEAMRRMHIPGIDYIFPGRIPPVVPKMAASVASIYGKERVLSECFALTGWDFSFEHMKWMTDWQLVHGVNLLVPHAFFYSISEDEPIPEVPDNLGFRWYDCPPSMFFQQPYWDYYSYYSDYVRRCCYLLSQGEHICRIAVYYPIETVQADFVPDKEYCNLHAFQIPGNWMTPDYLWEGPPGVKTDTHFRATCNLLRERCLDFDVIDDDSLREASIGNGEMKVRGRRTYAVLILPRTEWIATDVYRTIRDFWQQGGLILATGVLPKHALEGPEQDLTIKEITRQVFGCTAESADRKPGQWSRMPANPGTALLERPGDELVAFLENHEFRDFSSDSPHLFAQHRQIDNTDVYFLTYQHDQPSLLRITFKGESTVLDLDPYTGESRLLTELTREEDKVSVTLPFEPYQSRFIVSGYAFPEEHLTGVTVGMPLDLRALDPVLELDCSWEVTLDLGDDHPLRRRDLPPRPCFEDMGKSYVWDRLCPWEEMGLAEFSGGATYLTTFDWDGTPPDRVWLHLGEVGVAAGVMLNGKQVGVRLWRPYRFDVSGVLRKGRNELRVRVVNTLANAIQASYGKDSDCPRQAFSTFAPGTLRSGLMGPVQFMA